MELYAVYRSLKITPRDPPVCLQVYSDSKYVVDGIRTYSRSWRRVGRVLLKSDGSEVKNSDLWVPLFDELDFLRRSQSVFKIRWVKGHAGNEGNERADKLARYMAERARKLVEG